MKIKTKYQVIKALKIMFTFSYTLSAIPLLLFASSCSIGGKSSPSYFYVLDPKTEIDHKEHLNDIRMGVGPIVIPGYIDRPQIVTKTESAELQLAEFNRWAEPMDAMFMRTLVENIKAITSSHLIHSYPWSPNLEFDYRIHAKVIKFENNANGDALLAVHWQLINTSDQSIAKDIHSEFNASAKDTSYPARVTALNDTLAQFAQEIVNHID